MSDLMWWYVMRASGLVAWFFLTLTLLWGTIASGRLAGKGKPQRWIVDLHPYLGGIGLAALALHMVAAVADTYVGLTWANTVIPGTAHWRTGGIAAGVVAVWGLVAVEVTSLARRWLAKTTWRRIHLVSYAGAWLMGLHAVLTGTDIGNRLVAFTSLSLLVTATMAIVWRALVGPTSGRRPAETASSADRMPITS
jgi:sulfoxide reductase heme-binding subunit YedZ